MLSFKGNGNHMINITICDDSPAYGEILEYKIKQCMQELDIEYNLYYLNELEDLDKKIINTQTDILFLDLMINDQNSAEWISHLKKSTNVQIIYMTSYPEEAYSISETEHTYYIIKNHLTPEILKSAIQKAVQKLSKKDPNLTIIKFGSKSYTINLQNIVYIETFNNNLTLHMKNSQELRIYMPLSRFSENLPPYFLKCHKSFMVNMNHITSYEPHKFTLFTGASIPIPVKKYKSVIKKYTEYIKNI